MERAGKDEVTEEVERSGLGTPATRAGVIEKLIKDGYAVREKKNIVCTDSGAELISLAPETLKSPKFTANMEDELARIAQGKSEPSGFMREVNDLIHGIIKFAKENVDESKVSQRIPKQREIIGQCPRCKADVFENQKSFYCSRYTDGCKFTLWKDNLFFKGAKKELTKEIAAAFLKDGKVYIKDLYSAKKNKTYSATVVLDDTGRYVNFKFEF